MKRPKRGTQVTAFWSTPDIDKAIAKEQKRLGRSLPEGESISRSVAVRSLLIKASTPVEKVAQ